MKVLWLTDKGVTLNNEKNIGSGWIPSLENVFHVNNINLRIVFYSVKNKFKKHNINNNIYYEVPVYKRNNKIIRYFRRLFNIIENEKLVKKYLNIIISDFKPDVIHIWGSENVFGIITHISNIPHILHIQGNLTIYYHKLYTAFSKKQLHSIANINDLLKKHSFIFFDSVFRKRAERERKILNSCKNFYGRTDWDRRISRIFAPNSKYFFCDEILRPEFYDIEWKNPNNQTFTLISIFRDNIYKGLESIYQTTNILLKHKSNFLWKVIGVNTHSISTRLSEKYSKPNVKLPINLLGNKDPNQLIVELISSNLMVHPSHIDNSPNSICESMIIGLPVLTTSVGGIPSLIIDKNNGFLVQDGDPWAMAGAILEIIDNFNDAIKIGIKAKEDALIRHNKRKVFHQVIEGYEKIRV